MLVPNDGIRVVHLSLVLDFEIHEFWHLAVVFAIRRKEIF